MQLFEFVDGAGRPQLVVVAQVLAHLDRLQVQAQQMATQGLVWSAQHVQIDPARVPLVCLEDPLLAVTIDGQVYLVDGHHRLTRAALEKRPAMDVRVLDEASTQQVLLSAAQIQAYQKLPPQPVMPDLPWAGGTRLDSPRIPVEQWRQLVAAAGIPPAQARAFPSIDLTPGVAAPERLLWFFMPPLTVQIRARLCRLAADGGVQLRDVTQDILVPGGS
ncbi:hypothetical protein [Deinococcus multiflagellatus]|uniref:ParB/Sulfiredoxin domain-containing protein n=1 Tax=Deinococcus multiflagellatus TaxID=1656887 RepID=A0ABW1ZP28_9DEIO|nr:hypothetical protein [Deinococcus multiflagellatus]MBZ9715826.1 hypothetical protein [Deinococcus multiflagellatus]